MPHGICSQASSENVGLPSAVAVALFSATLAPLKPRSSFVKMHSGVSVYGGSVVSPSIEVIVSTSALEWPMNISNSNGEWVTSPLGSDSMLLHLNQGEPPRASYKKELPSIVAKRITSLPHQTSALWV